ncbi:MAG: SMC-Scp complex subunit ScpB [Patescibacteria group bacterium]|nr:SMC-Scp complex subunit ScpB [Patescibacteria group bacterium]
MITLDAQVEAMLFWKGESLSIKKLAMIFKKESKEIEDAIINLEEKLKDRGLVLIHKDDEIILGANPEMSSFIEELTKEELNRELGKAGLETLSIVLYQGPITRGEIDYIRGVNSNLILRNLLIRGLVEKIINPKDARSFMYRPTFELLQYLGISKTKDAPNYQKIREEIENFKNGAQ